jgi:hypothetical protein
MIDVEPLIRRELEREPLADGASADWSDVLRRANHSRRRPRRLAVALALASLAAATIAAVATPLGAQLAHTLGDFSAWLRGEPGEPATPAEQQAFDEENGRSWAQFPAGTQLRRLLGTDIGGASYTLYGFRAGDSLCLKLVVGGAIVGTDLGCAPVRELERATEPALVVRADEPFGTADRIPPPGQYLPAKAQATFGIVADGVDAIRLHADDGAHEALLGGNAFLYVADHPAVGTRVRAVYVVDPSGHEESLPFSASPFGLTDLPPAPKGRAQGPAQVERQVEGGTISWLFQHEARGEPLPADVERLPGLGKGLVFGRLLRPDPQGFVRVALAIVDRPAGGPGSFGTGRQVCETFIGRGGASGSCSPAASLFAGGPLRLGVGGSGADQFSTFSGIASDDVSRIALYLADGSTVPVPLADNVFYVRAARASFPARVVAYDSAGRVIAVETSASDGMTSNAPPGAAKGMRPVLRVTGPHGSVGVLRLAPPAGKVRCWSVDFSGGASGGGCTPWPYDGPKLGLGVQPDGDDVFINGQVASEVASIEVRFTDGRADVVHPVGGHVVYAVPRAELVARSVLVALTARDMNGREVGRRGLRITH